MEPTRRRFSANGTEREDASLCERNRKADQELAKKYKLLDERLVDAEQHLRSLRLPQPVYVHYDECEFDSTMPGMGKAWKSLAFQRHRGEWRLCYAVVGNVQCEGPDDIAWKTVAECGTDVRLEAIAQFGKLKVEAIRCKEAYVAKIDTALGEIDSFLTD